MRPHPRTLPLIKGTVMKWYQIAGDWKQFTGMVKEKWAKLTDGDLTTFSGNSDQLAAILQKKYGYAKDEAEREIADFARNMTSSGSWAADHGRSIPAATPSGRG